MSVHSFVLSFILLRGSSFSEVSIELLSPKNSKYWTNKCHYFSLQNAWAHLLLASLPVPIGRDGFLCPQSCPVECPEGEVVCPVDYDNNGCPMPLTCSGPAPEGQDPMSFCPKNAGPNGCLYTPQPDCATTDQACPIGVDPQGCHMGFNCHPMTEDCPMPSLPPPSL